MVRVLDKTIWGNVVDKFSGIFGPLEKGKNVLFDGGESLTLLKYEGYEFEVLNHDEHRPTRYALFVTPDLFLPGLRERRLFQKGKAEMRRVQGNIFGTHQLSFNLDEEFRIYLPSSFGSDLFLNLGKELVDGTVEFSGHQDRILTDEGEIQSRLRGITRPGYFRDVVTSFLEGKPTKFRIPGRKWPFFGSNFQNILKWFERIVKKLKHGDFVYVGCNQEVYLLALAKDEEDNPYRQGTYTTSAKPLFYFSNNYLDFISKHEAEKPKFKGEGMYNSAKYRGCDIPGFSGKPFIFPQMGREQNVKNAIFTGEPDVITGDIREALEHFRHTDFSEFSDIVQKYSEMIDFASPDSVEEREYFF